MEKRIHTLHGAIKVELLGLILPHEHLFTDLRGPSVTGYAQGNPDAVIQVVKPYLDEAAAAGVTVIVECSTVGVGRNLRVLQRLAAESAIQIIAPTGVYRDAYIPEMLRDVSEEYLADLWTKELTEGIDSTSIRAGFIKLAMSDDGPTPVEVRNLRAAAKASQRTGAVIGSHTVGGKIAKKEMDVLEEAGLDLRRFIWIHAQTESDISIQLEAARRGAFIELDAVGAPYQSQAEMEASVRALIQAGYVKQILLSHDAGWYNPARTDGLPDDGYRGYTALTEEFIPALLQNGVTQEHIKQITVHNPAAAFAF
ncbi:MAG: esterase [Anaerolineales bacterium]